MPVYLEPIFMSGERITVAIAAVSGDESVVHQAIDHEMIRAMYQDRSTEILALVDLIVDSLHIFITKYGSLHKWNSPISGAYAGSVFNAEGIKLENIVNQGIQTCSSLSKPYSTIPTEEKAHEQVRTLVKEGLITLNKQYKEFLNKPIKLSNNRQKIYSFVHPKLTTNIVVAGRGTHYKYSGLVKMMDINALKIDPFSQFESIGLIITKPVDRPLYKSFVDEMIDESDLYGIQCTVIDDKPESIAEYINSVVALENTPTNQRMVAYG
jgi:hypothetical protein